MHERTRTHTRGQPRRTQADRSATTRAKILAAVVRSVDEVGLARTTSQRIASEAGVAVGAVQHHYPTKADILAATLEDSFDRLSAAFDGASSEGASIEQRVSVFVDRAWSHYGSAPFRSTFEIILSTRSVRATDAPDWAWKPIAESSRRARRLWDPFFSGLGLEEAQHQDLLRFAFVTLSGMAMTLRLAPGPGEMERQVAMLKTALVALLVEATA